MLCFSRGMEVRTPASIRILTCFFFKIHTYVFFTLSYKRSARDKSHDICRLELGKIEKYDVFSETQIFVLTNNLRCFDETDVRTSQKTTYAQFKIYCTNFIDEIGPWIQENLSLGFSAKLDSKQPSQLQYSCADPESFVRRGPTQKLFFCFFFG